MNIEVMNKIHAKIEEYDKIIISRHTRPDGDCVGSSIGLKEILKATYPNKDIRLINTDYVEYLKFLGEEDENQPESFYADALGIIVDTSIMKRCSNPLMSKCKELIKIDHHIETDPYGVLCWVEEEKSSVCEMITEFYNLFKDKLVINKKAATALYTGTVTDSGRFKFSSVNGDTFRTTGTLLDQGIDIEGIYSNLYLKSRNELALQRVLMKKIKFTKENLAYIVVPMKFQKRFNLLPEEASAQISLIEGIRDSIIWVAFIEIGEKKYRVRLRSRYVSINSVAEKHGGGGHARACGATAYNKKEIIEIMNELDEVAKDFREKNPECH